GIDQFFLPYFHALRPWSPCFHDTEGLVARGEGRHAAALLDVEALAAAEIEVALPNVQVRMAHPGARDPHQDLAPLRPGRLPNLPLQRLSVFDDVPAQHFADSSNAWSMSQRISSSVSRPT